MQELIQQNTAMSQSSHWKPNTWELFWKGWERSHLSQPFLLPLVALPFFCSFSLPLALKEKEEKDFFFFPGMVALLLSWQLLFDHLRKSQGPNTSSPWFPRLLSQRLWSDSISNVLLLHKHSWEQCTSLDIQSRKSVSCQKSSPIILSRHLPSAVSSLALKFLLHKFKHVCFPQKTKPSCHLWLCVVLASSRQIYRRLAAHLLHVCQAQGGGYSAFV